MGLERQLQELSGSIIGGKHVRAEELTRGLLSGGCTPVAILNQGLMPGKDHVGKKNFGRGDISYPGCWLLRGR